MARVKKNGNQDKRIQLIVLATAILNLLDAIADIVKKLLE